MPDHQRERDLVLAPNEYAFISDQTKGNINVYVGPYKTSLANTDQPVVFNEASKRFERCNLEQATLIFPTAPEGWYLVLKNPGKDGGHPKTGTVNNFLELEIGHKVNIPGPVAFALWPGQMARVVPGHRLRSNQYLLVRVYDEEAARKNWARAIVKPQVGADGAPATPDISLGMYLVIRGTDVSFYIPPTGIEVVRDATGQYVREAVTLERLEYCILLDEDGNKRYIQGPDVVFPKPTEAFVEKEGRRKFRAVELNEISGLYVKVIAPYAEGGVERKVGDELFITGKEQAIYFPRPEHAVIQYGAQEIHYAVAIPKGEGRYVLDRHTGQIRLVKGPAMFLPDPRQEVIVRRVLDERKVALWFPGNEEALAYNRRLRALLAQGGSDLVPETEAAPPPAPAAPAARAELAGDSLKRKLTNTPPRTITLDTKYDGAVTVVVWTGYAVLVTNKSGARRVVVGPEATLLEYDESLEAMELSTGTPKSDAHLHRTVYLRVLHNKVSDLIEAETRDLVRVHVRCSYRVNFEGDPSKWFNVENYVKFLTDHARSLLRSAMKRVGIQDFYADPIRFVRDTLLGVQEDGKRPGRRFDENGMRVYDVEVLGVDIGDDAIEELLVGAQHAAVTQTLELAAEQRRLELVERTEDTKRKVASEQGRTRLAELDQRHAEVTKGLEVSLAEVEAKVATQRRELAAREEQQAALNGIQTAELARREAAAAQEATAEQRRLEQRIQALRAEVDAMVQRAEAVSPELIAALQAFSDRALVERVSQSMAPLAILGGKSVQEVLAGLLKGTALERVVIPAAGGSEG
jgi:major vault protein